MQDIEKKIDEILSRGVGEFIDPDGSFRKKLLDKASGKYDKEIIIKYGVDPTRPDIHLGHAVCFRKLRQLQDLGCKVVFLIGDYTARIGDPTGKSKVRPEIEQKEIENNSKTYLQQVDKIIKVGDFSDSTFFSWIGNSDWYIPDFETIINDGVNIGFLSPSGEKVPLDPNSIAAKAVAWEKTRAQTARLGRSKIETVTVGNLLWTLKHITHSRLIERDLFQNRLNSNNPLFMHEMLYPILQGLDSNVLAKIYGSCDLEIGGTDQTFNMLIGRDIMESEHQAPQSVMSLKLLEGLDGKEKMSKSLDNYIAITDKPNKMFLDVMSLPDASIMNYFELCTDVPIKEIAKIAEDIITGENPRKFKILLAKEIIKLYHGEVEAENAEKNYEAMSKGENPENIDLSQGPPASLTEFIFAQGFAKSKSDARRKVEQGGVEIEGEKILDWQYEVSSKDNGKVMRVGKKDIVKIVFKD